MRKDLSFISGVAIVALLGLTSCRSSDTEGNLLQRGEASVKVNLLGTDYAEAIDRGSQASVKTEMISSNNTGQGQQLILTPSSYLEAELTPVSAIVSSEQALIVNNAMASVSWPNLGSGAKYRIIAYQQSNGAYKDYKDYTIGQPAQSLILDMNVAYYLVLYSFGTSSLPAISSGEQTNINNAQVAYNNSSRDFMYQKVSYTPSSATGTITTTLRHKLAYITTSIHSINADRITAIRSAVLGVHYTNGNFQLSTGEITGRTTSTNQVLSFSGFPATTVTASDVLINNNTNGSVTGSFSATVMMNGVVRNISLPNSFRITPENQSNLTINVRTCGAYIAAGLWKEFTCQNVGATVGIDPFSPVAGNHGAKYQFGANTGEASRYVSQATDQSTTGAISWSTTGKIGSPWNNGTESAPVKTTNDPCPSGYRVPTQSEWRGVLNNNTLERVGTWINNAINYGTAIYFRNATDGRTLMLPTAGFRYLQDGTLGNRGSDGNVWSSSGVTDATAYSLGFYSNTIDVYNTSNRAGGESVRCIAQ
ncbi:fibrobacter succinogenes major paralogous domain-containing protein [Elizabethkingia anophelis]|uniref:hypothetical protein n=1 Tax=Elizabethkingia anophelis TaxID=1117645 RepID=UPI0038921B5D